MKLPAIFLAFALLVASTESRCQYGTLPGTFRGDKAPGTKWQLLTETCSLANLVSAYATKHGSESYRAANGKALPQLSALFLSDSMDRMLIRSFCDTFNGTRNEVQSASTFNYCFNNYTSASRLRLAQVYVFTMTDQDPVKLPLMPELMGYRDRMQWAKTRWERMYPGVTPNAVVLGGGVWDIQRWMKAPLTHLAPIEKQVRKLMAVSPEVLTWWRSSVKNVIREAQQLFPNSTLIWRTYAMPRYSPKNGYAAVSALGTKAMMAQVRAAGESAAIDMGLQVVDIEQMVAEFIHPDHYLLDYHHAKYEIYLEALNVILNMLVRGDK